MSNATFAAIDSMYKYSFYWYSQYLAGKIDSEGLGIAIRSFVTRNISAATADQLKLETQRLKQAFQAQRLELA